MVPRWRNFVYNCLDEYKILDLLAGEKITGRDSCRLADPVGASTGYNPTWAHQDCEEDYQDQS